MAIENTTGKSINDSVQTNSKSTSLNKNQNDNLQTKRKFCQELSIFFKKMTFYSDRNNQRYLEKEDQPEAISVK